MTDRAKLQRGIASILDHPSLYMGGPSQQNLRRAGMVLQWLERDGHVVVPREPTEAMLAAGDSMMPQIAPDQDITTGRDALAAAWPAMLAVCLGEATVRG